MYIVIYHLQEFIIQLVSLMLSFDIDEVNEEEIANILYDEKQRIKEIVEDSISTYTKNNHYTETVANFMNS